MRLYPLLNIDATFSVFLIKSVAQSGLVARDGLYRENIIPHQQQ